MTKCNGRPQHEMIDIVNGLRMCECCAEGWLANLKGTVDEARRLVEAGGGFDALRWRTAQQREAIRREQRERREELLKAWHTAGTYGPVKQP